MTKGTPGTRVMWLSEHDSEEEADIKIRIHLKPALRLRNVVVDFDFGELSFKGRGSKGNIITRHTIDRAVRISKSELELKG